MATRGEKYLKPQTRRQAPSAFAYELKRMGIQALDAQASKPPVFDQSKMSATGLLATTARDREGDVLEVSGIYLGNHQLNPIALLDHGLYYPLPIGRTTDAPKDGNYLVAIDDQLGECTQTTYFAQNDQVAEQVYDLYCQGVMKANSIGYRELEVERLAADPLLNLKAGKHILKSELIEATWCGIPCNQDAVMTTLSRGKVCGKTLAPAVKAMLLPYAQPSKHWANGATMTPRPTGIQWEMKAERTKGAAMTKKAARRGATDTKSGAAEPHSAVDETAGGALRREVENNRGTKAMDDEPREESEEAPVTEADQADDSEEPLGAEVLRNAHADLGDFVVQYTNALKKVEKDPVKDGLNKLIEDLEAAKEDIAGIFEQVYPDQEPLSDASEEGEEEADGEPEDEPVEHTASKVDYMGAANGGKGKQSRTGEKAPQKKSARPETIKTKRLTNSQFSDIEDLKALVEDMMGNPDLDVKARSALKYHRRSLEELLERSRKPAEEDEAQLGDEDRKAIINLERAIGRRERLLTRIGL